MPSLVSTLKDLVILPHGQQRQAVRGRAHLQPTPEQSASDQPLLDLVLFVKSRELSRKALTSLFTIALKVTDMRPEALPSSTPITGPAARSTSFPRPGISRPRPTS